MTCTLGGVALGDSEKPFDGELEYGTPTIIAEARPLGFIGRIITVMGVDAREHVVRFWADATTYAAIKALADAAASSATTHACVWDESDLAINLTVFIKRFGARKNRAVRRTARWDCELTLVEQ